MDTSMRTAINEAADFIRKHSTLTPEIVIITGSGLARLSDGVSDYVSLPYEKIPGFPRSTVEGHPGELVIGRLEGWNVAIQKGRTHFYEGHSLFEVTLPIRVLRLMGASVLIVTNAAGGINPGFAAGDLMLIVDHIGLPAMAGANPLFGPNDVELGPRFPVMAGAYDPGLRKLAKRVAVGSGLNLREGVYAWLSGPTFETPAEVRFMRTIGADAVGMSTVPEVIVARHGGMQVLGISLVTNVAPDQQPTGDVRAEVHQEVLDASARAVPQLAALIKGVLSAMRS